MLVIVIVIAILSSLVLVAVLVKQAERARTDQLRNISADLGLEFSPQADESILESFGEFRLFNRGHARQMKNALCGQTEDTRIAVFGYRFNTGGGQHQQVHKQTVMSIQSSKLSLPSFELRPEGMLHRIGQSLGLQDIDFDSHPNFSRTFLLQGSNETAIREIFTPAVLTELESRDGISIEAAGDKLIYYRSGKRVKPEEVRTFMEEGFKIYQLLQ